MYLNRMPICRAFSVTLVSLVACSLVEAQSASDSIMFTSNREGGAFELFRMSADGEQVKRVAAERGEASDMTWSPDGSKALYACRRGRNLEVCITSIVSGETQQLTQGNLPNSNPVWSPDGKSIVFVSLRDLTRKLYVMSADGSGQRRLSDSGFDELSPAYSPDGRQVAFLAATEKLTPRVSVVDVLTGKAQIVSSNIDRTFETSPRWSPDGKQLLFTVVKGQDAHIVAMGADGSARRTLTTGSGRNNSPIWSPDGAQILFLALRDGLARQDVYVMKSDGTDQQRLTNDGAEHMAARWSAEGKRIVFVKQVADASSVFQMSASGTATRQLLSGPGSALSIDVCCSALSARMAVAH